MREIIEDPDGAPYPEEVQNFYNDFGVKFFDEQALEDFRTELVAALESVAKFDDAPSELAEVAVSVWDNAEDTMGFDPNEDKRYTVQGDIADILTFEETEAVCEKWKQLGLENGAHSVNYLIADLAEKKILWSKLSLTFDAESSCFYAFTDNKADADWLADWINKKRFLR